MREAYKRKHLINNYQSENNIKKIKSVMLNYLRFLLIGSNSSLTISYFIAIFKKSIQESLLYFFSCRDFPHELIWHFAVMMLGKVELPTLMLGLEICRHILRTFLSNHPLTKMLLYKLNTFETSIRGFFRLPSREKFFLHT